MTCGVAQMAVASAGAGTLAEKLIHSFIQLVGRQLPWVLALAAALAAKAAVPAPGSSQRERLAGGLVMCAYFMHKGLCTSQSVRLMAGGS
jgi:hypothetical protein